MLPTMQIITSDPVDDSDFVAVVETYMGSASLRVFAWGFLEMAEIATERAARNSCAIDAVIPAILYSLRHSVELFLKYLIYDRKVIDAATPINGHNVRVILDKHQAEIRLSFECEMFSTGFDWRQWCEDLGSLIDAVHELDGDGQTVRYPASRDLVPNMRGQYQVSTKNLAACLTEIRSVFNTYDMRDC